MPLIILTGIPSSGKTTRTNELKEYFTKEHGLEVKVIDEIEMAIRGGFDRNSLYEASKNEKLIRGDIRSCVQRSLNPNVVLIVDGGNYIKGSRYELHCLSKLYKTTQCTIYCDLPVEAAWLMNETKLPDDRYTRKTFDALVMRYEPPDSRSRWDSPLFSVTPDDTVPLQDIYKSLFLAKALKPNLSTQTAPVSSTNYLYELDRISQKIIDLIIAAHQMGVSDDIQLPDFNLTVNRGLNTVQLIRLRRQFLTYSKMHQIEINQIPKLFVQYLNKSVQE